MIKNNRCLDCNKLIWKSSIRCQECNNKYMVGERTSGYKDGRTNKIHYCIDCGVEINCHAKRCRKCVGKLRQIEKVQNYCVDCGIEISYKSKRCISCDKKNRFGKNNHNYKNGKFQIKNNKCVDCEKSLKNMSATRCKSCARKELYRLNILNCKGKNNSSYKDGRCSKKYYCNEEGCNNEISYQAYKYKNGKCRSCMYKFMVGKNAPNWQGGLSFELYPIEFTKELKEQIRKRDNYTCQLCGKKQGKRKLPVHHIDYNKENLDPNNLISLCMKCHAKTNFNREFWETVFTK